MERDESVRVATFNIRHGRVGHHWPSLPWRLRDGVRLLDADICGLQEVDRRVVRSWFVDQPALTAKALRAGTPAFALARRFLGGDYGNALLARGAVSDVQVISLPLGVKPEPRVVLVATVHHSWLHARVAVTHLQNHTDDARLQLQTLAGLLGDDLPAIVMGDLNLHPDDVAPALEAAGYTVAGGANSSPVDDPYQRIDHVAVRGLRIEQVDVPRPPVSDHRPVIVTLVPGDSQAR